MSHAPAALLLAAFAGLAALAMPAYAADTITVAADAPDPGDKIKCRYEAEMGSRTRSKRTCKTVTEWAEDSQRTKRELDSSLSASKAWTGGKPQ